MSGFNYPSFQSTAFQRLASREFRADAAHSNCDRRSGRESCYTSRLPRVLNHKEKHHAIFYTEIDRRNGRTG